MHKDFESFCRRFKATAAGKEDDENAVAAGIPLVQELLSSDLWWRDFIREALVERNWFKQQPPTLWPNEITLYRSPDQSFLILAYIWEPYSVDTIHDHGSWGIVGSYITKLGERKYERTDDGRREGYCELRETAYGIFGPGETTFVLPLDKGLHAMDNTTDGIAVSINVYGKTVRQGYIQFFDPAKKTVTRAYPPRTLKEVLAVKTLAAIDPGRAEGVFREALASSRPPQLRQEYEEALRGLRG